MPSSILGVLVEPCVSHSKRLPVVFPSTHWSVIVSAREGQKQGLERLCREYWRPVFAFLRQRNGPEEAKDLAQGFFAFVLSRDFLAGTEPGKGRFRSFVIAALKHYVADEHRRSVAEKRGGGRSLAWLDEIDDDGHPVLDPPDASLAPDEAFDRAWAVTVLTNAAVQLRLEAAQQGRGDLFEALEPALFGETETRKYKDIADRFGTSEGAVKQLVRRHRERPRSLIRMQVERTVADATECEAELRYFISLLARR